MMCQGLQDSLVLFLLYFFFVLNNCVEGGIVQFQLNFDLDYVLVEIMGVLQCMCDGGLLLDQILFNEVQCCGMFVEDLDWELEQEWICNQEFVI